MGFVPSKRIPKWEQYHHHLYNNFHNQVQYLHLFYLISTSWFFPLFFLLLLFQRQNGSHGVTKEGVTWEKDAHRWVYKVQVCNASYLAKYLLVKHFCQKHNFSIKSGKPRCHIPNKRCRATKIIHQWMSGSEAIFFLNFNKTTKKQLLEQIFVLHASGITCKMMPYE